MFREAGAFIRVDGEMCQLLLTTLLIILICIRKKAQLTAQGGCVTVSGTSCGWSTLKLNF